MLRCCTWTILSVEIVQCIFNQVCKGGGGGGEFFSPPPPPPPPPSKQSSNPVNTGTEGP